MSIPTCPVQLLCIKMPPRPPPPPSSPCSWLRGILKGPHESSMVSKNPQYPRGIPNGLGESSMAERNLK